jgi:hypothetical protein
VARRSEAIKLFLNKNTHIDLATLYSKSFEVQVNVAKDDGERVEAGDFRGKGWIEWTDGIESWKAFRIPMNANSTPEDNDSELRFNLDKHVEGIGMTGWNWEERKSYWVAFDFDAMLGHSDKHAKKLTDKELAEIQEVVTKLPFVTVRRSTSGRGLHLYIFIEPIETANHTEHAALARSILSLMAGLTGFNFTDKVDIAGGNMWVWHRKMIGTEGLKLIRSGVQLPKEQIPTNWRDHLNVVTRRASRVVSVCDNTNPDIFDELTGQRAKVKLDPEHLKLINWLNDNKLQSWWNADQHMLVTHTAYLAQAHKALKFRGEFHTVSSGREFGTDINCFAFPCRNGVWALRRYGTGTKEHRIWKSDPKGWTRCYYNRDLTLEEVARLFNAIELENRAYQFNSCKDGTEGLLKLGVECTLPEWIITRPFKIRENLNDGKYICVIPKVDSDNAGEMQGWVVDKTVYRRIFHNPRRGIEDESSILGDFDDVLRHIVSEQGEDLGWLINDGQNAWRGEPINHLKLLLKAKGIGGKEIDLILGSAVSRAWTIVNRPFQPEYPGDRQWNRSKARFKIPPTLEGENLTYPTWQRVLNHSGASLDDAVQMNDWCRENGVHCGADYLKLYLAALIKYPQMPLPFLGFYGDQNSGKSTLHEMFCDLILDGGYTRADNALINSSGFNGELEGTILAIVEETNLAANQKVAYNRVKDWVTSSQISIHKKGSTPYMAPNYCHWIQCANEREFIPVFAGDTRVTLIYVGSIPKEHIIPKRDLRQLLLKEAPDFLASLLSIDIPDSRDRLMIPVIRTMEKEEAEFQSMNAVEQFFKEKVFNVPGVYLASKVLYDEFIKWLDPTDQLNWTRNKFGRDVPKNIPKGRIGSSGTQDTYYGNVSLSPNTKGGKRWVSNGLFMKQVANEPTPTTAPTVEHQSND